MCKKINLFFPIYIFSYLVLANVYSFVVAMTGLELPLWAQYFISEGILLLPPIIYIIVNRINVLKCLPIRKIKPLDALLSLLLGYALIPAVLLINYISMFFATNYMEETQSTLLSYPYLMQILLIAVLPPLVEEFIFRGLFYHSYRRNGVMGAAIVSGLIFGAVHMNINQFCYAFLIGIVFALLVEATGSIWASVMAHFAINTFSITIAKLATMIYGSDYMENAQSMEATYSDSTLYIVAGMIELLVFAAIGLVIAFGLYYCIAKRNGRWVYMRNNIRMGMKAQNGEKFFNVFSIATFIGIAAFMIIIELV